MRILPTSDIHLERRRLEEIPTLDQSFDALVCAGDICEGQPEKAIQSVVALAQGKPSIIVAGNHDLWTKGPEDRRTISEFHRLLRNKAERQNARAHRDLVTVLSADDPVCELEQIRFIGVTLRTDWAQAGRWMDPADEIAWAARARAAAGDRRTGPREYGAIRTERGGWTPYDAVAAHAREKAILRDELEIHHDGPTVVVTHHPPLADCADVSATTNFPGGRRHSTDPRFSPICQSTFVPDLWVFGHVHAAFDVQCGRTREIANPIEGGQFNPNLVIEI
jgi:predicted phosphodiesterase